MSSGRGLNGGVNDQFFNIVFSVSLSNLNRSFYVDSLGNVTCFSIDCATNIQAGGTISASQFIVGGTVDVEQQIVALQGDVTALQNEVDVIDGEILVIQGDISTLNTEVAALQTDVTTLDGEVATLDSQVATLQGQVSTLQSDVSTLQTQMSGLMALPKLLAFGDINWSGSAFSVASSANCTITSNPGSLTGTHGINYTGTPPGGSYYNLALGNAKLGAVMCEVTQNVTISSVFYNIVIKTYTQASLGPALTNASLIFFLM